METFSNPYTWRTRQEIQVCADCIHVAASGAPTYEGYTESGHAARYAQGLAQWHDEPFTSDDESSFSMTPCDYCGDTLGGNRFTATVMELHVEGGK